MPLGGRVPVTLSRAFCFPTRIDALIQYDGRFIWSQWPSRAFNFPTPALKQKFSRANWLRRLNALDGHSIFLRSNFADDTWLMAYSSQCPSRAFNFPM